MQMFYSPRVHMPDQINFNPSADRTDVSFFFFFLLFAPLTICFGVEGPGEQLYLHVWSIRYDGITVNTWWTVPFQFGPLSPGSPAGVHFIASQTSPAPHRSTMAPYLYL